LVPESKSWNFSQEFYVFREFKLSSSQIAGLTTVSFYFLGSLYFSIYSAYFWHNLLILWKVSLSKSTPMISLYYDKVHPTKCPTYEKKPMTCHTYEKETIKCHALLMTTLLLLSLTIYCLFLENCSGWK